jgi:serine/threonine protein kinase
MTEAVETIKGRKLDARYTLLEKLGAGGQGEVWRAHDGTRGIDIALKVLNPTAHEAEAWSALEHEYAIASRLDHPSILKVFPPERSGDAMILPMELASGGDLRRLRGAGFLEIIPVLLEIAQALEHAHERGVVHRDLKPGNVLFDARGRARLADFGVAETAMTPADANAQGSGAAPAATRDTNRHGFSPFTASPAQLRGEPPTPADDVYGLGALAYELLSGYPPYYPHFDKKRAIEERVPTLVPTRQIPPLLGALVMHMLAKDPKRRPRTIREVIDELDAALNDTLTFDFENVSSSPTASIAAAASQAQSSRASSQTGNAEETNTSETAAKQFVWTPESQDRRASQDRRGRRKEDLTPPSPRLREPTILSGRVESDSAARAGQSAGDGAPASDASQASSGAPASGARRANNGAASSGPGASGLNPAASGTRSPSRSGAEALARIDAALERAAAEAAGQPKPALSTPLTPAEAAAIVAAARAASSKSPPQTATNQSTTQSATGHSSFAAPAAPSTATSAPMAAPPAASKSMWPREGTSSAAPPANAGSARTAPTAPKSAPDPALTVPLDSFTPGTLSAPSATSRTAAQPTSWHSTPGQPTTTHWAPEPTPHRLSSQPAPSNAPLSGHAAPSEPTRRDAAPAQSAPGPAAPSQSKRWDATPAQSAPGPAAPSQPTRWDATPAQPAPGAAAPAQGPVGYGASAQPAPAPVGSGQGPAGYSGPAHVPGGYAAAAERARWDATSGQDSSASPWDTPTLVHVPEAQSPTGQAPFAAPPTPDHPAASLTPAQAARAAGVHFAVASSHPPTVPYVHRGNPTSVHAGPMHATWGEIPLDGLPKVARLQPIRPRRWPWVFLGLLAGAAAAVYFWLPRFDTQTLPPEVAAVVAPLKAALTPNSPPGAAAAVTSPAGTASGVPAVAASGSPAVAAPGSGSPAIAASGSSGSSPEGSTTQSPLPRLQSTIRSFPKVPAGTAARAYGTESPLPRLQSPPTTASPNASASTPTGSATDEQRLGELRQTFDTRIAALEARGAGAWGGREFATAKIRAAESVGAQDAGNPRVAQERLTVAMKLLDTVETKAPQVYSAQVAAGEKALGAGQQEVAGQAFDLARRINPTDRRASDGLRRAQNLNAVLPLLADAQNAEAAHDYARAAQDYSQALFLDPGNATAKAGQARANAAFGDDNYAKAVGSGFAALGAGRLDAAHDAFVNARALKPNGAEASEGLRRVSAALAARGFASMRQRAAGLEAQERWEEAERVYEDVLAADPSLAFAQEGKVRTTSRADLSGRLQQLLDRPDRLSTPGVREDARALLETARAQSPQGPVIRSQIARLEILLPSFDKPVRLSLLSDNSTQVVISSIGSFGSFARRDIELRPGKYTVVGTRYGFRDVRREITVAPGQDTQTIKVTCSDPI